MKNHLEAGERAALVPRLIRAGGRDLRVPLGTLVGVELRQGHDSWELARCRCEEGVLDTGALYRVAAGGHVWSSATLCQTKI